MNLTKMVREFKQMQGRLQEALEGVEVEGSSGGGVVCARMNGRKQLLSVRFAPEALTPEDPGLMADLVVAAVNDAGRKVDEEVARITRELVGGLPIPPGLL